MAQFIFSPLNPLDHLLPRNYVKSVSYFPLRPNISYQEAFTELQHGLHRTFLQLPWLSGKVHWRSRESSQWRPGELEIRHIRPDLDAPMPYQLQYNEVETDITYEEIQELGYPTNLFDDDELLWADFLPSLENGTEVFVAQANFVPGACMLASAVFHSVTDGMGSAMIFKIWADNCRTLRDIPLKVAAETVVLPPSCTDRTLMSELLAREKKAHSHNDIPPETWGLLDLAIPEHTTSIHGGDAAIEDDRKGGPRPAPKKVMDSHTFYISTSSFASLKHECSSGVYREKISGTDALYALIWRALMKARASASTHCNDISHLELAIDLRNDFSDHLPPLYLGNCVLHNVVSLPVSSLTTTMPLHAIADELRERAARFTPTGIHDAYTLLKDQVDLRVPKLRFTYTEGMDTMISSMLMFPVGAIALGG